MFEVLEDFFHFDTKLFRTIGTLLFRPGQLSAEFDAGKRAAQMPPFRLYIFVSVLFFFVSFYSEKPPGANRGPPKSVPAGKVVRRVENGWFEFDSTDVAPKPAAPSSANPTAKPAVAAKKSVLMTWFESNAQRALDHPDEFKHLVVTAVPKLFLICVPGFALLTWLLFRRAAPAYLTHLVVALHFHSFVYLWSMASNGWIFLLGAISPGFAKFIGDLLQLWVFIYPFLMLRHLFKNSWPWTLLKGFALFLGYYALVLAMFAATAAVLFTLI
jgi:hypothetical protein